ncbi:esterase family protein [Sphingomonas sp. BK345]|uniref:alpha/beta hydrolase n=1 Tax=Sphingomonas sp. BK345 TaxID=2586980 RepID=UPI00161D94F8|nr:alpha/beta hydrolase-fold protein [Sphingomonas sp. BK345]MBB3472119.1 enterochelin esterase-like enzyme [Sphingomonas sp. BK345]
MSQATATAAARQPGAASVTRLLLASASAALLIGAAEPAPRLIVTLRPDLAADARGRLLVFATPASGADARGGDAVDLERGRHVWVAGRDVAGSEPGRSVTIDGATDAFPASLASLAPGSYHVQAVLDRDGDYNFAGRAPGDLLSEVVTVRLPLASPPTLQLDHAVPPATDQFDTAGLPPAAAAQITASRPHLHDERIASRALTRFRGERQAVAAWVLTPPGYDPASRRTYPTVFTAGGFGVRHKLGGQQLSRMWHLMETGAIPPMIWVALDHVTATGTTEFADSASNGPWGEALVRDVIPALETRYRMDARPSGRFLTGHSSGGWFALWAMVRYPRVFGGSWATAPDPVDFHDFIGVDLYARDANMYRASDGAQRPLERDHGEVLDTIEGAALLERVLGREGGQLHSFEWVFSPRRSDGNPAPLFDRATGAVDFAVAAYWREHYDIVRKLQAEWPRQRGQLGGKLHVIVGDADSYYLDGPVHRLDAALRRLGDRANIRFVPGATHSMAELYASAGDRNALWEEMTRAMYAAARPGETWDGGYGKVPAATPARPATQPDRAS